VKVEGGRDDARGNGMSIHGALTPDAPRFDEAARNYDALLIMSFGGPERPEDVAPFLARVAASHHIPPERLSVVADHYHLFGGVSPINRQNRALMAALRDEFRSRGLELPVYLGNRNWHPFVADTVREMRADGVRRALAFVTSVFSSYSGCRQYREDIIHACETVGEGAPVFDKLRVFYNHPGFIEPMIEHTRRAAARFGAEAPTGVHLVFTAHSVPLSVARGSEYVAQLEESCRLVADGVGTRDYRLVYQSRSGSPRAPWLEPDIGGYLREARAKGIEHVVVVPIGFLSDHMEVLFDLDTEARAVAERIGLRMVRADTVGTHPAFVRMIRELVEERTTANPVRRCLGTRGPGHDVCPLDCCLRVEPARSHLAG
jgi:ferrochelatase